VNAIDHTPTALNAIVFSNFPDALFDKEIRDKLIKQHVNVVQVYKPDRVDAAVADVSKADAVIVFIDFMSHPQDDLIRKKARAWGKPIAALRRQSSDWTRILADVMPKPKSFGELLREERATMQVSLKDIAEKTKTTVAEVKSWEADEKMPTGPQLSRLRILFHKIVHHPSYRADTSVPENDAAPESLPPHVKQAMNTFMSLTAVGVGEDEILQAMCATTEAKDLAQVEDMFERYVKTDCAPAEFRSWWEDYKKAKPLPTPPASQPSRKLMLTPPAPQVRTRFRSFARRPPADQTANETANETDLSDASEVVKQEIKEIEAAENDTQGEIDLLKQRLKETQEMGQLFEDENKRMHDELKRLVDEKVKTEIEQHVTELALKIRQLEKEKATFRARVEALVNEKTTLQTNLKMLVDEREALAREKKALIDENEELRKVKSPLQEAISTVTDAVSSALSAPEVESLKKQLEASYAELDAVKRQTAVSYASLVRGAEDVKKATDQRHAADQAIIADLRKLPGLNQAEATITDLQKQLAEAKQGKEHMRSVAKTAHEKLEVANKQASTLEADRLAEKSAREAAEKKLAEVQSNGASNGARDLDTIAASFRNLHKLGFMSRADIAEKLVSQVLGQ